MAHDVFISYSSDDRNVANAVCARLEGEGVRCWIAPRDILPGTSWGSAIIRAISETRVMVLLFSAKANRSPQILREVERAVGRGVVIVPVRIEDVKPEDDFEYFLSSQHWLDVLTAPLDEHLDKICAVVKRVLAVAPATPSPSATQSRSDADPSAASAPVAAAAAPPAPSPVRSPAQPGPAPGQRSRRLWLGGAAALLLLLLTSGALVLNRSEAPADELAAAQQEALTTPNDSESDQPPPGPAAAADLAGSESEPQTAVAPPLDLPAADPPRSEGEPSAPTATRIDPPVADARPPVEAPTPSSPDRAAAAPVTSTEASPPPASPEAPAPAPTPAPVPATGILVMVRGEARDAQRTESLIAGSVARDGELRALDPATLQLLRSDSAAVERALVGDVSALAALAEQHATKYMLLGELSADAQPSVGRFYTGTARLDLTMYEIATGAMIRTQTFAIGSRGVPGKLGPTPDGARADAVDAAGTQAATAVRRWLREAGG